jgi:hypothetical protein
VFRIFIVILIALLHISEVKAQFSAIEKLKFSSGDYRLICRQLDKEKGTLLMGQWVSTDTVLFTKLQNQIASINWIEEEFESQNSTTFELMLFMKDSLICRFWAYPNSNQIQNKSKFYHFNYDWFFDSNFELTPIYFKTDTFTSADSARQKLQLLSNNDSIVFFYPPDWKEYDGFFRFPYHLPLGNHYPVQSYSDSIKNFIINKFGTENFNVTIASNDGKVCGVKIESDKDLFNSLKQDKITWGARHYEDSLFNCSFDLIYRTSVFGLHNPEIRDLAESSLEEAKGKIDSQYPNTPYEIIYSGFGGGGKAEDPLYFRFTVNCDRSLFKAFDLYESFCFWNRYKLELKYYYKN